MIKKGGLNTMIGESIKRNRLNKKMTLSDLARQTGLSKSYLSYIERGIKPNPSIEVLKKITRVLDLPLSDILPESFSERQEIVIDEEWQTLIREAIQMGMSKQQFKDFQKYMSYKTIT